jgi:hypothetical protein
MNVDSHHELHERQRSNLACQCGCCGAPKLLIGQLCAEALLSMEVIRDARERSYTRFARGLEVPTALARLREPKGHDPIEAEEEPESRDDGHEEVPVHGSVALLAGGQAIGAGIAGGTVEHLRHLGPGVVGLALFALAVGNDDAHDPLAGIRHPGGAETPSFLIQARGLIQNSSPIFTASTDQFRETLRVSWRRHTGTAIPITTIFLSVQLRPGKAGEEAGVPSGPPGRRVVFS